MTLLTGKIMKHQWCMNAYVWNLNRMILTGEDRGSLRETCPIALSTTNYT